MSHVRTLALSVLIAVPLGAQSAPTRPLDPKNVDRRYGACEDFYMFANNGWIERNPIPSAFASWGTFNELSERNTLVLKGIAERAAARSAIRFSTSVFRSLSSLKVPQLANADGIGLRSIHPLLANM